MSQYPIPAKETQAEIEIKRSRFIATAVPVFSVDEAKAFIRRMKQEFSDASHNVPAYQIGHGTSIIAHSSDDGEPSGTAGRPLLAVLQGSGLGDIAIVVTRYYGGVKLGTGGLVRAYGDAGKAVLAILPRAQRASINTVQLEVPYPLFEQMELLIGKHNGRLQTKTFAATVTITAQFLVEDTPSFADGVRELSNGRLQTEIIDTSIGLW